LWHIRNAVKVASQIHSNERVNLIVAQGLTALAGVRLKKKLKLPLIVSFHAEDITSPDWLKSVWRKIWLPRAMLRALQQADGVRVVSPEVKKNLTARGLTAELIKVFPTPINLKTFLEIGSQRANAPPNDQATKNLLSDGRLEPVKNLPFLLKAFQKIAAHDKGVKLTIHGRGSQEEALQALARDLEIADRVNFIPLQPVAEQPKLYQEASIYVSASSSESFGQAMAKAAAAGLPVVAAETAGAKSVIKDGKTGYIVKPSDEQGFVEKVNSLLGNADLRRKLGQQARARVEKKFDQEKIIKNMINWWGQVAGR